MTERAVPSDPLLASKFDKAADPFNEKGEQPDRYGEWLADDARIWRVYERLAKQDDEEKVKRWSGGLNNLALFATLFAGITTAFIIESQGDLKPDYAELAYRVQIARSENRTYVEKPFVVPGQARTVNGLWIASLLLSLSAALIAVMGQDWVGLYMDNPVCNPRQWAEIRSFRLNGVLRWRMPGVIATAPVLLHASLFLFGIGLAVFMTSDVVTRNLCIALCAIIAFLYLVVMFSPVFWSSSPFRSPATVLMREWFCAALQRNCEKNTYLAENAVIHHVTRRVAAARRWIKSYVSMAWAVFDLVLETYGSRFSTGCTAIFRRWSRRRDISHGRSLLPNRATRDPENPVPVFGQQAAPPGRLPDFLSRFPATYRDRILARYGPDAANVWKDVFCQWFSVSFRHERSATRGWVRKCYSKFHVVLASIRDSYGPDFSNGWSDISETPSAALVADSLSWLSSASSSPEVTQLVVTGLCDHVIGPAVAGHANARSLTEKLYQYADDHWEHMSVLDLSRHVIASANAGRSDWPGRVQQRFRVVLRAGGPLPQDILLALAHLTWGFQAGPLAVTSYCGTNDFDRLCARILDRNPITVPTIASIIALTGPERLGGVPSFLTTSLLMSKWCDELPTDLSPIEHMLCVMLDEQASEETNKLTTLCQMGRPVDNIIHMLIAVFIRYRSEVGTVCDKATRDLVISLACRAASESGIHHPCLAAMFGNSDPHVTRAAWSSLPADDIESALDPTYSDLSVHLVHTDLRPMLARMIARCIRPPFPLRAGNISVEVLLSHAGILFSLVDAMYKDGALPDDLFSPVLQFGALDDLAAHLCRGHAHWLFPSYFLTILAAITLWIMARRDVEDQQKSFVLFTGLQTTPAFDGVDWDLVDAIGTVLETSELPSLGCFGFCKALGNFMTGMRGLRRMFPGPELCTLWVNIARKFGANKHRFALVHWRVFRQLIQSGTGIDPEQFAMEDPSYGAGSAVQEEESALGGNPGTIVSTNDDTGAETGWSATSSSSSQPRIPV